MKNILYIFLCISFFVTTTSCSNEDEFSEKTQNIEVKFDGETRSNFDDVFDSGSFNKLFSFGDTNIELEEEDFFLVKYNSSGVKQWSESLKISDNDSGITLMKNTLGEIYITGYISEEKDEKVNPDNYEIFLIKYNVLGIRQWEINIGNTSINDGMVMNFDSFDNLYVSGFANRIYYGNLSLKGEEFVIMKFNSFGINKWVRSFGVSAESDITFDVSTDSSNNIFLTGFSNSSFDETHMKFNDDTFIIKYNSDGSLIK